LAADRTEFKDYLVDIGMGHVSASDMLKVSRSAVTTIEAPKDFVTALNAFDSVGERQASAWPSLRRAQASWAPFLLLTMLPTLRRSDRELDLQTIAGSPAYRRFTIAGHCAPLTGRAKSATCTP
jgi:hypothetical protein